MKSRNPLAAVFLLGLVFWFLGTIVLSQQGFFDLSILSLGVGVNAVCSAVVLIGLSYSRLKGLIKVRQAYFSLIAFFVSAFLFLYAYDVVAPERFFYVEWAITLGGIIMVWLSFWGLRKPVL